MYLYATNGKDDITNAYSRTMYIFKQYLTISFDLLKTLHNNRIFNAVLKQ